MGVVNVTPDSFSDGGSYASTVDAVDAARRMLADGAALVDVGGESTRPGAEPVSVEKELRRVVPVLEALSDSAVSIDTSRVDIARRAIELGTAMVNDVSALRREPELAEVVAEAGVDVCLMHMRGTPRTMQDDPRYDDVLVEIYEWLEERVAAAEAAGIARDKILIDPGFGFGKTVAHNLELMNGLALFHSLGCPLVLGASRKRTIGALSNEAAADQRLGGSIAFALKAFEQGAQIVRVHDVPETVQALRVWRGLRDQALTPRA